VFAVAMTLLLDLHVPAREAIEAATRDSVSRAGLYDSDPAGFFLSMANQGLISAFFAWVGNLADFVGKTRR
jgi:hypothetical protein